MIFVNSFFEMLNYSFMVRALVAGICVAICSSMLGVVLVLKRYSMIGFGLSNVAFATIGLALVLKAPTLITSIIVVVIASIILLRINNSSTINGDSAVAFISTIALAIGVLAISISVGMNTDICNYLFGSLLGVKDEEAFLSIVLSIVVCLLFIIFYNRIFATTFDENFSTAIGINVNFVNSLIATLSGLTIVFGMRTMGSLLISSLIIFPALTSMQLCKRFITTIICSLIISVFCFVFGLTFSYIFSTPTGASIALANVFLFLIFFIIKKVKR